MSVNPLKNSVLRNSLSQNNKISSRKICKNVIYDTMIVICWRFTQESQAFVFAGKIFTTIFTLIEKSKIKIYSTLKKHIKNMLSDYSPHRLKF